VKASLDLGTFSSRNVFILACLDLGRKEGKKKGRKEGRKEERKKGRKEIKMKGRKEGRK
jgi:predicted transposase YdaD